jgi:hypothetical protein
MAHLAVSKGWHTRAPWKNGEDTHGCIVQSMPSRWFSNRRSNGLGTHDAR